MTFDIGIDFTVNTEPPRVFALTDWECRLVEHCLARYVEAAEACDDATLPLAESALSKIKKAPEHLTGLTKGERQGVRHRERRSITEWPAQREHWRRVLLAVAEIVEGFDPALLDGVRFDDDGSTVAEWLKLRRERWAPPEPSQAVEAEIVRQIGPIQ